MSAFVIAIIVITTAASGAVFKPGEWYEGLNKPAWTPPNLAFPVVWTCLYMMIGYAGWLVWEAGETVLFVIWLGQLALNGAWSWLFFGRHAMGWALVDIAGLLALILLFVTLAWFAHPLAAGLFLPYAAWVSLAGALNWRILRMNPSAS